MRYVITPAPQFDISGCTSWMVKKEGSSDYTAAMVYRDHDTGRFYCQKCSGPLAAMKQRCPHTNAARRYYLTTTPESN